VNADVTSVLAAALKLVSGAYSSTNGHEDRSSGHSYDHPLPIAHR